MFCWFFCGVCVVFVWCLTCMWCLCGVCGVFFWCLGGVCVVFVWVLCGVCVVFVWRLCGVFVYVWCLRLVVLSFVCLCDAPTPEFSPGWFFGGVGCV